MTRWQNPPPVQIPASFADLHLHPLVAQTLVRRGVTTPEAARAFLSPERHSPVPFPGIEPARELVRLRDTWLNPEGADEAELKRRTLTNLYNQRPTWLDQAHARLDAAVFDAYGWPNDLTDEHILERLLALCGLCRREAQTPGEFAADSAGVLAGDPLIAPAAPLLGPIVEAYYRVRFGGPPLSEAERRSLIEQLTRLEAIVSQANRAETAAARKSLV